MPKDGTPPAGFDSQKRESLLKMAKISAFAVPTIATFSLDSVRNVAHAQESTTTPTVLTFSVNTSGVYDTGSVQFSKSIDTTKPCIQWTFVPAYTGPWVVNVNYGWVSSQYYGFSLGSTYSGLVYIMINTASQSCASSQLVADLYGNPLASYQTSKEI